VKAFAFAFAFGIACVGCGPSSPPREPQSTWVAPPPPAKGTLAITAINVFPAEPGSESLQYVGIGTNWPGVHEEVRDALFEMAIQRISLWRQLRSMMEPDVAASCSLAIRCEDEEHRRMAMAHPHLISGYCLVATECQGESNVHEAGYNAIVREDKLRVLSLWELVGWYPSEEWTAACKRVVAHDESLARDASLLERCTKLPKGSPPGEMDFHMTNDALIVHLGADDLRMPWKDLHGAVSEELIHEASRLMPLVEPWAK
jgi:hypothetical protein